jgi:drug/metabolite transporter (DMT)-like permease
MTPLQLASLMMLGSGLAHAVVNAILKSGKDKMASRALIDGFSAILIAPFVFFLPLPTGAWGWLALSGVIHLAYLICLIRTFERADFSVAYPVLRGVAPVIATIGAVALFGEPLGLASALGVALVSIGVITVGFGRALDRKSLLWALATGAAIAAYTVVDAQGVRAAPSAPSYIAWVFLILGGGVGVLFARWRGPTFILAARTQWRAGLAAGALSIVTYGLALWALRLGDTPRLSALRETSILFAAAGAAVLVASAR